MSAAASLVLLPWTRAVVTRHRLRAWMLAAERLDAGLFPAPDYPPPRVVAMVCEILHDTMLRTERLLTDSESRVTEHCDDAAELIEWIDTQEYDRIELARTIECEERENVDLQNKIDALEQERDQVIKERDSLQKQCDRAEEQATKRIDALAAIGVILRENGIAWTP